MPPRIVPLNPLGRPPKIGDVIAVTRDGRRITRAERIVQSVRAGNYIEAAAPAAGVDKTTVYEWLNRGANVSADIHKGKRKLSELLVFDRRCLDFSHAVAQADAEWEVHANTVLEQLAQGGLTATSTKVKKVDGKVVEETTTTETLLPNDAVIRWRLERKHMDRYGRRQIEISGPDGKPVPVEMVRQNLLDKAAGLRGAEDEEEDDAGSSS